jgi:hypothetical protein
VGQRTFETRSLYLILAEKLFTLPAANEMLPLSALFAGRSFGTRSFGRSFAEFRDKEFRKEFRGVSGQEEFREEFRKFRERRNYPG